MSEEKAVLFENRYMDSLQEGKEMLREYYKKRQRIQRRVGDVLLIIVVAIYVCDFIFLGFDAEFLIWFLVSTALCIFVHCIYLFQTATAVRTAKKIHKGKEKIETVWRFYEDEIELIEGEQRICVPYTYLTKRMEMNRYIALLMPRSTAVIVKKGCFTKGIETEFDTFIKRKCPKWKE